MSPDLITCLWDSPFLTNNNKGCTGGTRDFFVGTCQNSILQGYRPLNFLYADISKYAGPSDLTGKNQASPTMFSAYRSESPVKICSLLRSGNNFLFVGLSNSVFKSRSFLQFSMFISLNKRFLWITYFDHCVILKRFSCSKNWID